MNFNHVWIARHWVAPAAQYVCCNVAIATLQQTYCAAGATQCRAIQT